MPSLRETWATPYTQLTFHWKAIILSLKESLKEIHMYMHLALKWNVMICRREPCHQIPTPPRTQNTKPSQENSKPVPTPSQIWTKPYIQFIFIWKTIIERGEPHIYIHLALKWKLQTWIVSLHPPCNQTEDGQWDIQTKYLYPSRTQIQLQLTWHQQPSRTHSRI